MANCEIRNFPYEKPAFLLGKLYQKFFVLHSNYNNDTPYRVWFGLHSSWTRSNRPIFKIPYSRNSKNSVWNPYEILTFFTRQIIAKTFFVLHSTYTGDTKCRNWFGLDNSKTQSITTTIKFRFSRSSQISVWKLIFFVGKL